MTPELTTTPTPRARGWRQRARGRRSGMQYSWNRGGFPRPLDPGSDACSWQAGHHLRGSLSGARSPAVDLSRRTQTLPVLPRWPRLRLTAAVLRPPWWPPRPLPRAGSPLVRPAGVTRRPTRGVGRGTFSLWLPAQNRKGGSCRIRSVIWVSISLALACPYGLLHQKDTALIWEMSAVISRSEQMERPI
jgi:hypothetical protein